MCWAWGFEPYRGSIGIPILLLLTLEHLLISVVGRVHDE
jgi:hypothetical protein